MLLRYVNVVVRMKHLGLCLEDVNDSLYGPVGSNYVISNLVPRISLLLSLQGAGRTQAWERGWAISCCGTRERSKKVIFFVSQTILKEKS